MFLEAVISSNKAWGQTLKSKEGVDEVQQEIQELRKQMIEMRRRLEELEKRSRELEEIKKAEEVEREEPLAPPSL